MQQIFLESHNIKNLNFGFGQFNYHLIKAIHTTHPKDFEIILHAQHINKLQQEFGDFFNYKKYHSLRRYSIFRVRKKYDLWHCLNQNIKIEPYHNIPYLLTVHNISYIKDKTRYKNENNHIAFQEKLDRSDAITYISEYAKSSTHEFFDVPEVPEYVIYNGNTIPDIILPDDYTPSQVSERPFLFSIGEFTERKNFNSLIHMLNFLSDFNLIIAGKNSTKNADAIKHLIAKNKLENRVILPGKISELDKQYYYNNCAAFVFPSLREGFGLPVIEAMRFGKPVFLSNNTSLPEIGTDLAFYWDHYEPKYMSDIIITGLHTFNSNKVKYIDASIKHAKSFSWDNAAKQYIDVYRNILNSK